MSCFHHLPHCSYYPDSSLFLCLIRLRKPINPHYHQRIIRYGAQSLTLLAPGTHAHMHKLSALLFDMYNLCLNCLHWMWLLWAGLHTHTYNRSSCLFYANKVTKLKLFSPNWDLHPVIYIKDYCLACLVCLVFVLTPSWHTHFCVNISIISVSIQMSDRGGGVPFMKTERLFSYMYSTAPRPSTGDKHRASLVRKLHKFKHNINTWEELTCVCVCAGRVWLWSAHLSPLCSLLPGRLTALLYGGLRHWRCHTPEGNIYTYTRVSPTYCLKV